MGVPPYRVIYQVIKSDHDWVYLVKLVDRTNARVLQVLRQGHDVAPQTVFERNKYKKDDLIPLTDKGKYRRMKILASGQWEEVELAAVFEAI